MISPYTGSLLILTNDWNLHCPKQYLCLYLTWTLGSPRQELSQSEYNCSLILQHNLNRKYNLQGVPRKRGNKKTMPKINFFF